MTVGGMRFIPERLLMMMMMMMMMMIYMNIYIYIPVCIPYTVRYVDVIALKCINHMLLHTFHGGLYVGSWGCHC